MRWSMSSYCPMLAALGTSCGLIAVLVLTLLVPAPQLHHVQINRTIGDEIHGLIWFLQISDLHVSQWYDLGRVEDLLAFAHSTLHTVKPAAVVVTGDLTDAKFEDLSGSGQLIREWEMYRSVLDEGGLHDIPWLDVRGNHDNFDVRQRGGSQDLFARYSEQGRRGRLGHYHHLVQANGVRLAFVAVDATTRPGFRRPFNFIGRLTSEDIADLSKIAQEVETVSDYQIWFGHYPTSAIVASSPGLREIAKNGLVYLCGHLHSLYSLVPDMFAIHSTGLVEAELEDWKDGRKVRLVAVDSGLLSYTDTKQGEWPLVHVTWPPRLGRARHLAQSTHIRVLVFAPGEVTHVDVAIDGMPIGICTRTEGFSLYVIPWNQSAYPATHNMQVKVGLKSGETRTHEHWFSFSEQGYAATSLLGRVVLLLDLGTMFQVLFLALLCISTIPLILCRSTMIAGRLAHQNWLLTRLHLVATVDRFYYPLTLFPIYLAVGPWCLAELVSDEFGLIFSWGTLLRVDSALRYVPTSTTWLYAAVHLAVIHVPVVLILASLLHARYSHLNFDPRLWPSGRVLGLLHLSLVGLLVYQAQLVAALCRAYGSLSLLGPMRLGYLLLTALLWHATGRLERADFRPYQRLMLVAEKIRRDV